MEGMPFFIYDQWLIGTAYFCNGFGTIDNVFSPAKAPSFKTEEKQVTCRK
jgi:hypothetical protein